MSWPRMRSCAKAFGILQFTHIFKLRQIAADLHRRLPVRHFSCMLSNFVAKNSVQPQI